MAYTKYSLTPANNTAAPPDGAPEGMLPSAVNDTMRDMMAQIRDCGDGIRDGTYTMTAPKITGGTITGSTINNSAIGGTTAAAGKFTTLEATGVATFSAGAVGTPAITTTGDTNTGIFFPAADTIAFAEGGVESMRIDSSGNVGIGTSSPDAKLEVNIGDNGGINIEQSGASQTGYLTFRDSDGGLDGRVSYDHSNNAMRFATATTERMRIDSSGNVMVGTTTATGVGGVTIAPNYALFNNASTSLTVAYFQYNSSTVGSISRTTTATTYATSSDYRLKENIAPMQNALNVVQQLKPVTYKWKADGSDGQGFIAHELQAVVPDCVTGEKDGEQMQGVDTSFLVATLTAALQELKAELDATKAEVQALKGV